ncbi:MAG: sulfite exporter TauE/SafE family protein [Armatimonadetes bacterium]|nr:sulfite exporter TauE/SafE family protein [Armatimonadota bacterium]
MDGIRDLIISWYGVLNTVFQVTSGPLQPLVNTREASLAGILLLGMLGATSPCQLSTSASALAYLTRGLPRQGGREELAYAAGKTLVYAIVGLLAITVGQGLSFAAIPVVQVARKLLGPLMILVGLLLLGILRPRLAIGAGMSAYLRSRAGSGGAWGAFFLGVAFAFAWCPTLSVLFFGTVIPMALASSWGAVYPALFALGTVLPLLTVLGLIQLGVQTSASLLQRMQAVDRILRPAAAVIFLLAGMNDTLLYWIL